MGELPRRIQKVCATPRGRASVRAVARMGGCICAPSLTTSPPRRARARLVRSLSARAAQETQRLLSEPGARLARAAGLRRARGGLAASRCACVLARLGSSRARRTRRRSCTPSNARLCERARLTRPSRRARARAPLSRAGSDRRSRGHLGIPVPR